jgi:hypothetical protein
MEQRKLRKLRCVCQFPWCALGFDGHDRDVIEVLSKPFPGGGETQVSVRLVMSKPRFETRTLQMSIYSGTATSTRLLPMLRGMKKDRTRTVTLYVHSLVAGIAQSV